MSRAKRKSSAPRKRARKKISNATASSTGLKEKLAPDLERIWKGKDDRERVNALERHAETLTEEAKSAALEGILQFDNSWDKGKAFRILGPHLSEELRRDALSHALGQPDGAYILSAIVEFYPAEDHEPLITWIIGTIQRLKPEDAFLQAETLSNIAPFLSEALKPDALDAAKLIKQPGHRAIALVNIGKVLDEKERGTVLADALAAAHEEDEPWIRGRAFAAVARVLPDGRPRQETIEEAFTAVRAMGDPDMLLELVDLVPNALRETVYAEALELAEKGLRVDHFGQWLVDRAGDFPTSLHETLPKSAEEIKDKSLRAKTLLELQYALKQTDEKPVGGDEVTASEPLPIEAPTAAELSEPNAVEDAETRGTEPGEQPGSGTASTNPVDVAVRVHSDNAAVVDELNRAPFARMLADVLRETYKRTKSTMGASRHDLSGDAFVLNIHGPWGSGKSSVLNFLRNELTTIPKSATSKEKSDRWVVINFNAWRHQRAGPPWWALISAAGRQSAAQLWQNFQWRRLFAVLWCRGYWTFRTRVAPWLLAFAVILWLVTLALNISGSEVTKNVVAALTGLVATFAVFGLLLGGFRSLLIGSSVAAKQFVEISRDPMRPIVDHFRGLVESTGGPVAIFIDDLDRCESEYVIELLRGIQTLFHEANVSYVVAADRDWLRASYEEAYKAIKDQIGEPGRPLGHLFLDKLFQVSVPLPRMSPEVVKEYLARLVSRDAAQTAEAQAAAERKAEEAAESELEDTIEHDELLERMEAVSHDFDRYRAYRAVVARRVVSPKAEKRLEHALEEFKHLLEANPRSLKRLVNRYGFAKAISILSDRDIDLAPLVRWTILHMRWPLLAEFLERDPEKLDMIGSGTNLEEIDEEIRQLFTDSQVAAVVDDSQETGKSPLDVAALRKILGRPNGSADVSS